MALAGAFGLVAALHPDARATAPAPAPAELFAANCAGCHGKGAEGSRAPNLFDAALLARRSDGQLRHTIHEGIADKGMPGFAETISDAQTAALVAHLRARAAEPARPRTAAPDPDGRVVRSARHAFRIEVVARGLETPWGLAFLPDGRLLVTERPGRLRIIERGRLLPDAVPGTPRVWERRDAGLLDVALDPDFRRNGWIYLALVEPLREHAMPRPPFAADTPSPPSMTVVVRGRIDAGGRWTEEQTVFRAAARFYTVGDSHYGSRLVFDRTGHLFFSIGDRGEMANAADLSTPLGKIHRVNADGSVPRDNPFVGRPGAVPTIWSYGHRNPEGLAFSPSDGLFWESEHGPLGGDEINLIERGHDYGWGRVSMGMEPGITATHAPGLEAPVAHYTPTIAPSGIAFYRGDRYPGWRGDLFVAGLAGQQLRRLSVSGRRILSQEVLFERLGRTRAVATGPDGLLYVLLQNPTGGRTGIGLTASTPGMVVRLVPVD